jgi:ribosome biogenesis protein BMS1
VDLPRFNNPMIHYGETRMLKTHAEVRRERNLPIPSKGKDSEYARYDEKIDRERDERVFATIKIPKAIEANLPFKSKQKVKVLNDAEEIDSRRKTNLLEALNLPTKRPFKKMFMNDQEKKIYSMVQRLAHLGKEHDEAKKLRKENHLVTKKKREEKEVAKRLEKEKSKRKDRYMKANRNSGKGREI